LIILPDVLNNNLAHDLMSFYFSHMSVLFSLLHIITNISTVHACVCSDVYYGWL